MARTRPMSMQDLSLPSPDSRPGPGSRAPLLQFDSSGDLHPTPIQQDRFSRSKSVFGLDKLWEKEMVKLKILEEQAAKRKEEQEKLNKEKEERENLKGKGKTKNKGKGKAIDPTPPSDEYPHVDEDTRQGPEEGGVPGRSPVKAISNLPPVLRYSPVKQLPTHIPSLMENVPRRAASRLGTEGWFGSSDASRSGSDHGACSRAKGKSEGEGKGEGKGKGKEKMMIEESDSEEDIPLSRIAPTLKLAVEPAEEDDEEDEDDQIPLSSIARKPVLAISASPAPRLSISTPNTSDIDKGTVTTANDVVATQNTAEEEDDDLPLAHRRTAGRVSMVEVEAEDDLPLGYKHAQAATRQMAMNGNGNVNGGYGNMTVNSPSLPWGFMGGMMSPYPGPGSPWVGGYGPVGAGGMYGGGMGPYSMSFGSGMGMGPGMGIGMVPGMGMGPGMNGFWPTPPAPLAPPGRNIDEWRMEVGPGPRSGSGVSGSGVSTGPGR